MSGDLLNDTELSQDKSPDLLTLNSDFHPLYFIVFLKKMIPRKDVIITFRHSKNSYGYKNDVVW